MALTIGLVTDLHSGPPEGTLFEGRLRKLSHEAPTLTRAVVQAMNAVHRPDLLVNLGDDIEDEGRDADLARYAECQAILRTADAELVNVAGNHDLITLNRDDLGRIWQHEGPLFYSLDRGGFHLVVLHTIERKDIEVRIRTPSSHGSVHDLAATTLPVVVLMHHPASDQDLASSFWFHRAPHLALVQERAELRAILESSGKVRIVFNGHVHRNHLDLIRGIPYVTIQSLVENLDDDAPGRPAAAYAIARLEPSRTLVRVHGNNPVEYQFER